MIRKPYYYDEQLLLDSHQICDPDVDAHIPNSRGRMLYYHWMDSPVGPFLLAGTDTALHATSFSTGDRPLSPAADWREDGAPLHYAIDELTAYFDGALANFTIPIEPHGTPFQLTVWRALQKIPFGQTWSYGQLAREIGQPTASRAVGAANGQNCLPIVIPCHRVIGASGKLTGFGGGLDTKRKLLRLEGIRVDETADPAQLQLI